MNTKLLSNISKSKLVVFGAAVLLMGGFFVFGNAVYASVPTTWTVNAGASTSTCAVSDNTCTTIQDAIGAANSGDTINVLAGNYSESVNVNKSVTLNSSGANITDSITIASSDVTIDGFDITNPTGSFGISATDQNNLNITNNTIHNIGSDPIYTSGSAQAIVIVSNAANVSNITISGNHISEIGNLGLMKGSGSDGSAKGIYIGNSGGLMDFDGVIISGNNITNIYADGTHTYASGGRGAYGILVNHDSHSGAGYGSTKNIKISNNTISNLDGLFSHAIGLEGNTPDAVVEMNTITNLTEHKQSLESSFDAFALRLEDNPSALTVTGTGNTLDSKPMILENTSIVVDPSVPNFTSTLYPEILLNNSYYYAGVNAFSKIQDAINAVSDNGTINVAAGTYDGFSVLNKSGITITGAGKSSTIILPSTLIDTGVAHKYTSDMKASVFVNNSTNVVIKDMTIESNDKTPGSGGPDAIVFWNASSGSISSCAITGIYTINGVQTGQGIAVDASGSQGVDLAINNCDISGFQKNGIDVINGNGATSGSTGSVNVTVTGGNLTGAGAIDVIAQNGMVLWNRGEGSVTGSVNGTTISGFNYAPSTDSASGILAYGGGVLSNVKNITFADNEYNLSTTAGSPDIDATNNYWSDANGPELSTLDGNITYSPWFTDSGMTTLRYTTTNDGTNASTTVSGDTTLTGTSTASGSVVVTADIHSGTVITGNTSWDGTLVAPTATTTTVTVSGYNTSVSSAIAIGSNDSDLSFDQPVKLTFAGQTGKLIGWYNHAGIFSEITSMCDSASASTVGGVALAANGSCKFDDGTNMIVWTRHFSTFVTYTKTAIPPSGGGGGGSSGGGGGGGGSMMLPILINASSPVSTTVGVPITVHITVTDQNGRTPSIQVSSLPAGMTFSTTTMDLTWTPTAVGSVSVTITANDLLTSATKTITLQAVSSVSTNNGQVLGVSTSAPQGQVLGVSAFNFTNNLNIGSQGDDVTELQNRLTQEGVYSGPITGYFGQLTFAGVKAYQAKHGISQVGTVGPMTRAQLNSSQVLGVSTVNMDALKTQIASLQAQLLILLQQLFQALQSKVSH